MFANAGLSPFVAIWTARAASLYTSHNFWCAAAVSAAVYVGSAVVPAAVAGRGFARGMIFVFGEVKKKKIENSDRKNEKGKQKERRYKEKKKQEEEKEKKKKKKKKKRK
ncbi:hypothetical protein R6870_20400, partial [Mycobacterium tuberculosis]